jgi:hypothetical protein
MVLGRYKKVAMVDNYSDEILECLADCWLEGRAARLKTERDKDVSLGPVNNGFLACEGFDSSAEVFYTVENDELRAFSRRLRI